MPFADLLGGRIVVSGTSPTDAPLIRSLPEARWNAPKRAWTIAATPGAAAKLMDSGRFTASADVHRLALAFDTAMAPPRVGDLIGCNFGTPLWDHQKRAFAFCRNKYAAMLAIGMGGGKSLTTVSLLENWGIKSAVILCPRSVIGVWRREFEKHSFGVVKVLCLDSGTSAKKATAVEDFMAGDRDYLRVVVVNYESAWRDKLADELLLANFDASVLDESHRIKQPTGAASKFAYKLGKTTQRRLCLTGTPCPHALTLDTPVLTPTGWKPMGEIEIGDHVIGKNGKPVRVIGVWPQGVKDIFRVTFSDGASVECTGDHLWEVNSRGRSSRGLAPLVIETSKLSQPLPSPRSKTKYRSDASVGLMDKGGAARWHIPLADPVDFECSGDLPIHPYLLGVLLGDGHIGHNIDFTTADDQIRSEVEKVLPDGLQLTHGRQNGKSSRYRITSGKKGGSVKGAKRGPSPNPLFAATEQLGIRGSRSHDKFVPEQYLWSSVDNRLALLQGLCDTDGSATQNAWRTRFVTTSEQLANDVVFLIRSLGGIARIGVQESGLSRLPNGTQTMGRRKYHVYFRMQLNPFRLDRKRDRVTGQKRGIRRNIVSVEPCGFSEAQCITVDAEDGLFVTKDFIVTHNSPLDLYAQYRFLEPAIFGTSFSEFRSRYAVCDPQYKSRVLSWQNQEELTAKTAPLMFQVKSADVLDLPPCVEQRIDVVLEPKARRIYDEFGKELIAELEAGTVTAANALTKLLRWQQMTSGYVASEDGELLHVSDAKSEALEDLIADMLPSDPVVVFCRFRSDIDVIRGVAAKLGRTFGEISGSRKDLTEHATMPPGIQVMAVQQQSGGTGIDLTAARYAIWYSQSFSLGDNDQANARVHRPGQTKPVTIYRLVVKQSVDETIARAIEQRREVVEYVLDSIKPQTVEV